MKPAILTMAEYKLNKIDARLVSRYQKNQHKGMGRFVESKAGFVLATLAALYKAVDETLENQEQGHYIMMAILAVASLLLLIFSLRHIIWHKRIEHFEYRIKVLEIAIILYACYDTCQHIGKAEGYFSTRPVGLVICTIGIVMLYSMQARLCYLKAKNIIPQQHSL